MDERLRWVTATAAPGRLNARRSSTNLTIDQRARGQRELCEEEVLWGQNTLVRPEDTKKKQNVCGVFLTYQPRAWIYVTFLLPD